MPTAAEFFQSLRDSQRLLLSRSEVRWMERYGGADRRAAAVVNFGCGVQLTPHLMVETVDVLSTLGVDVVAVAGAHWCCGMPRSSEDAASGLRMTATSDRRMASFGPQEIAHWCGAWWVQLPAVRGQEDGDLGITHMTEFVLRALAEHRGTIPWQTVDHKRVLLHGKTQDLSPEMRVSRAAVVAATESAVPAILDTVPGVELVGEAPIPSTGSPCTLDDGAGTAPASVDDRRAIRHELAVQAEESGADLLVCAHHQCYREWAKFASPRLPVRHYMSVVAEGLGLARASRFDECWSLGSIDAVVESTRPMWQSWDLGVAEATQLAQRLFPAFPAFPAFPP